MKMATDYDIQKELLNRKVYSAWQFIVYTKKNIEIVGYCYSTIKNIIEKMTVKTVRWEQNLFSDFVEDVVDGKRVKTVSVTTDNQPVYELRVAGEKIDPWFLFDKLLRDFYQYSMNSLDSIAQIANAGLLGNKGKKVDSVDFQKMASTFAQQTYKADFPQVAAWFDGVNTSDEFKYIEAINNRTKHTADIANKLAMGILGSGNKTEIGPFFRKDSQHDKRELTDQLQATIDFIHSKWDSFLNAFCSEVTLEKYVDNRRHEIDGVYQQRLKDEPDQDLSYAFIQTESDFSSMPSELYILFAYDRDGEIAAHVCPFDNVFVRKGEHEILGRYTASDVVGDDCLLQYRRYVKDENTPGVVCMFNATQEKTIFYHSNPFFTVTSVSNDDEFLKRSSLPF